MQFGSGPSRSDSNQQLLVDLQQSKHTLSTMVDAGCTGEQDIDRAELLILVVASEAFLAFKLYTDCSTAKSAWD